MTEQSFNNWLYNYESAQKHKHANFLKELKHEFTQRTRQQRRDRLDQINQQAPSESLAT